ncbi:hypothetical protein PI124_g13845 [Phytophthora idaei]|nr:hypothetical protein PI124_g13845 [Phytophthora idaei]
MRWYCVHPNLPLHAELRIRAAPDSSAAERARIPQGRSIASCSPVFQVPGDGVDSAPISWLQVAYHDNVSGETETGFMMAALPDGTTLVTPWESTDFYSCCEVTDSAALLYDGPHETARSFGLVQSVNFLYCTVEEAEKRARVFHPELESVWIEKKDLHIVCTRFKHGECSTPHTFFELSGALPEEAQIAIREYPLKEAQTVGLLSRGETVEVTVRGGNWLRIAGGGVDKAWIMWRTDALELLQEAPDVCSSTCERTAENANSLALNKSVAEANPDQIGDSGEVTRITPAVTVGSVQADTANDATPVQNVRSWCDRTCPARKLTDEEGDSDNDDDVDAAGTKLVPVDQSWDDRPPLAAPGEGIDNDNYGASAMAMEMDDVPVNRCNEDDKTQIQVCTTGIAQTDDINGASTSKPGGVNGGTARKAVVTLPDERPIHPARYVVEEHVIDERADAASVEVVKNGGVASPDERPIRPAGSVIEEEFNAVSVELVENSDAGASASEPEVDDSSKRTEATAYPDEHPIHPARYVVEEHVIDERADAASVEVVKNGGVASPDERPIRPAGSVIEEEFNAVSVELVENSDAGASASEPEVDDSSKRTEATAYPDEHPIHPARYVVEEHVIDERADAASVEVVKNGGVASPDERPIRPAGSVIEEEFNAVSVELVENSDAGASASEPEVDDSSKRTEATAYPDEHPIHPARYVVEEHVIDERADAVSVELVENGDAGADFVRVGDCAAGGVAKAALSARIYGTIGCGGTKAESNSESEAGDIAVLGGLDDVFDPVDELIVDILVKDTEKTVGTCEYAVREENEQSDGDMDNRVTTCSFTLVAQEKPNVEDSDDAALFLQEFGIIKYCERKQSLNPASDKLSQAMFNADQDDADLVFEVLVGDDPLSDEWFHDVAAKSSAATLHSEPCEAVLKLSLSVDSGDTYTLIMGDATPEDILESELLDDDDGNYDLVRSFRYPLPTRRHEHSGNGLSPVRSPPSSVLRQHQSASAESSPVSSVKPPMPSTQSVVPPTVSATPSGLAQRKSIGAPSSIAKPPSALVRPRSFVRTPATPSKMSVKPASSRLTQHAPTLSGLSSSKTTKSFLPTPSPQKVANTSARTNTILKPAESSGLPTPWMSFGFRRLPKN